VEEDGLADAFRSGSAEGFRAVYERYSGAMFTTALRILGDRELAAYAVQVTFLNAWC
jgi:RNA polymerase sigma-70 factor (ECF subfamily)